VLAAHLRHLEEMLEQQAAAAKESWLPDNN
jgi:hypothetical protein